MKFVIKIESLKFKKKRNLYTLHSWIGFATMTLFFVQYFGGFYAYLFPTASGPFRSALLPYHVLAGFALLILSLSKLIFYCFFAF